MPGTNADLQKIKLRFRKRDYEDAVRQYNKKETAKADFLNHMSKVLSEDVKDPDKALKDPMGYVYRELEKRENPMKLKGEKLAQLWDIDTSSVAPMHRAYLNIPAHSEMPTEEEFTDYVETEEEHEKYAMAHNLAKAINQAGQYTSSPLRHTNLSSLRPMIQFNDNNQLYEVDIDFVKSKHHKKHRVVDLIQS